MIAHAQMVELSNKLNESIHLAVIDDTEFVYIDKVESQQPIQMRSRVGNRGYLHSTAIGKVLLAFIPEDDCLELLDRLVLRDLTPNTITTPLRLKQELRLIRSQFYANDNEENECGIRCVAAPILDFDGKIQAAISVSGSTLTMTEEQLMRVTTDLLKSSRLISNELGYRSINQDWWSADPSISEYKNSH